MLDLEVFTPANPEFFKNMQELDQIYRRERKNLAEEDSVQYRVITRKIIYQDSLNRCQLIDYISKHGYPGGYKHTDPIVVVLLLHSTRDWFFKNYPLFMDEIKKGRMNPRDLAFAFDRIFSFNKEERGTTFNVYVNASIQFNIDPELIFINRCSIGLNPYFENPNNLIYKRGSSPTKSQFYNYYSEKKENFNCSRFK